jgi:hypothetical protein
MSTSASSLLLNLLLARDASADVNAPAENLRASGARLRCNRISTDAYETGSNRPVSFLVSVLRKNLGSYQGIASAMPEVLRNQIPL